MQEEPQEDNQELAELFVRRLSTASEKEALDPEWRERVFDDIAALATLRPTLAADISEKLKWQRDLWGTSDKAALSKECRAHLEWWLQMDPVQMTLDIEYDTSPAGIRSWLRSQGHSVPTRGRIPASQQDRFWTFHTHLAQQDVASEIQSFNVREAVSGEPTARKTRRSRS